MSRIRRDLGVAVIAVSLATVPALIASPNAIAAGKWTAQNSGTSQPLYGVDFIDRLHGWAVGGSGTILATSDSGAHWVKQHSGTTSDLRGVSFANRSRGWATGWTNKVLLTTRDGGKHWTKVANYPVTDVEAADAQHALAVGSANYSEGVIVRTTNGTTWTKVGSPISGGYIDAVEFVTTKVAYAAGSRFTPTMSAVMLKSTDGGRTWAKKMIDVFSKFQDIEFVGTSHGWAVGYENSLLFRTSNGGATWSTTSLPKYPDNGKLYPRESDGISFADRRHGLMATFGETDNKVVYASSDGGKTWKSSFVAGSGWGRWRGAFDVDMVDTTHAWAVGTNGRIIRYVG